VTGAVGRSPRRFRESANVLAWLFPDLEMLLDVPYLLDRSTQVIAGYA
jgi:hypothetical protein